MKSMVSWSYWGCMGLKGTADKAFVDSGSAKLLKTNMSNPEFKS